MILGLSVPIFRVIIIIIIIIFLHNSLHTFYKNVNPCPAE